MQKTHKRLISIILLTVSLFCFLMVGTQTAFASTTKTGAYFSATDYYEVSGISMPLPYTFEAVVTLPSSQTARAGVIVGDYAKDKKPCFSFEVYEKGAPRLYLYDGNKKNYDVTFDQVNICTGSPVHVAITVNGDAWCCYVDGVLKQTVVEDFPATFNTTSFRLGGDFRTNNTQYFKGTIQKLALYSTARTPSEISADMTATTFDTTNLLTAYDISTKSVHKVLQNIPSVTSSAYNLSYCGTYFENWKNDVEEPENYDYSFAVIGDIQSLNYYYPEELSTMYEWIRDNAESKKIKYAISLGDITEKNTAAEYERVNNVYSIIDGVVPYSLIRGNHDRSGSSSANYDKYITQAKHGDEITGAYDKTMLNTYRIMKIGKVKYMFMNLDFLLKDEVLTWAGEVISANPDCQVIVSTHIYMSQTGGFYSLTGSSGIGTKYYCKNNGQGLWDKLLSKHDNIVMLLCGHNPTNNIYYRTTTGENANKVTEMLIDPQQTDIDYAGTGLIAMFYFSEDGTKLDVRYYSTIKDAYFKSNNQFSIEIDTSGVDTPPAHTCKFNNSKFNATQHWMECSCGEKSSIEQHAFINGICRCSYQDPTYSPTPTPNPSSPTNPDIPTNPSNPDNPTNTDKDPPSNEGGNSTGLIIGVSAGAVVVLGGVGTFIFIRKRKLK